MQPDNKERYLELRQFLARAEKERNVAAQALVAEECSPGAVEIHLARAWYWIAAYSSARQGRNIETWEAVMPEIRPAAIRFPAALPCANWQKDLAEYCRMASVPPVAEAAPEENRQHLRMHLQILGSTIAELERDLRKEFSIPWIPRGAIWVLVSCLLFGLILWLGYEVFRQKGPWHARYYLNRTMTGEPAKSGEVQNLSVKTDLSQVYSAQFDTCFMLKDEEDVTFELGSDDGSRLYIDGIKLIDMWQPQPFARRESELQLKSGRHHLRVEYFQIGGQAGLSLNVRRRNGAFAPLDRDLLYYPRDAAGEDPCR